MCVSTKCVIFVCLLLIASIRSNQSDQHLPQMIYLVCRDNCICDHSGLLRRSVCDNKKLLNVKDNVPKRTQILHFTNNYVTTLHNFEFRNCELEDLIELNVSSNIINTIEIDAFQGLHFLEVLDLSHNALQFILSEWFWPLTIIKEVYLQGNNFGVLKDEPLFESHTLQILNLAHCKIPHLYASTLSKLTMLSKVDLSNNYLIQFQAIFIAFSPHLKQLVLSNNPIKCKDIGDVLKYLEKQQAHLELSFPCELLDQENESSDVELFVDKVKLKQFEHMKENTETLLQSMTGWFVEEDALIESNVTSKDIYDKAERKEIFMTILLWSPIITLTSTLCFGLITGFIMGLTCNSCLNAKSKKHIQPIRRLRRSFSIIRTGNYHDRQYLIPNSNHVGFY